MRQDYGKRKPRWPARLFITGVVLFMASGGIYFAYGKKDPRYSTYMRRAFAPPDYTRAVVGDRLQLEKDRDCRLPDLNLVFRGVENGRLRFDAFVLQLDPASAYVHRIDPDLAESGFNMGGKTFRLLSWNGSRVRLELIRPQ
ncbi:MAG: hypothetical protein PVG78_16010 [Desulfobacterales bacterium]|jgi:hypothetical protein